MLASSPRSSLTGTELVFRVWGATEWRKRHGLRVQAGRRSHRAADGVGSSVCFSEVESLYFWQTLAIGKAAAERVIDLIRPDALAKKGELKEGYGAALQGGPGHAERRRRDRPSGRLWPLAAKSSSSILPTVVIVTLSVSAICSRVQPAWYMLLAR
jgi:hypothetical protein